jgi:hypothetical protein
MSGENKSPLFGFNYSYHPSLRSVGATEATLGVGEATRDGQSCLTKRLPGLDTIEPSFLEETKTALGACIESHTDVGGVFVRLISTLAVGVAARLGYTVLARESGRGGEDIFADRVALYCSWATRASRAATWSRNLFSRC